MATEKLPITYVTSSAFKREEAHILATHLTFSDGKAFSDLFEFSFRQLSIPEMLEVDLVAMVQAEAKSAYRMLKVPCIVEHAGLIFDDFGPHGYPGGLTKPMWDTLKDQFLTETNSAGRRATARAAIAYCDGMTTKTFVGETTGVLAGKPRGDRSFYWDTVFIPDDPSGKARNKTYAEIVADSQLGLTYKVMHLSQSTRAMLLFLSHLRSTPTCQLWA